MTQPKRTTVAALRRRILRLTPPLQRVVSERNALRRTQARLSDELAEAASRQSAIEDEVRMLRTVATVAQVSGAAARSVGLVVIVAYGRSGSTLVQGILNSIPGYLIRGENRAALYSLWEYHHALETERERNQSSAPLPKRSSWYGIDGYATDAAVAGMRALVLNTLLRPEAGTRVTGFKEIRWWQNDWQEYIAFLRTLFPGARFIINTRDHEAVARSKWWTERKDPMRMLARYEKRLDDMTDLLGEDAFRVHYDDYVADPDRLAPMFDWLGESYDRQTMDAVMQVKYSY